MKWQRDRSIHTGQIESNLIMSEKDVRDLQEAIPKAVLTNIQRKVDKYEDRHSSGEGTDRDVDLLIKWEKRLETLERFLNL